MGAARRLRRQRGGGEPGLAAQQGRHGLLQHLRRLRLEHKAMGPGRACLQGNRAMRVAAGHEHAAGGRQRADFAHHVRACAGTQPEIHDGQMWRSPAGHALQAFARIGHGMDFGQAELFQELGHAHGRQRVVVDHQGIAPRLETGGIGQEGMAVHGPREGMSKGLERQGAPGYTLRTS